MFDRLAAPFPKEAISWRAQSLREDGSKAMALAYIDARDVMRRLDEVCGPASWQDSYTETASGRVLCTLSILCDGQWVSKTDGAGNTDVEGDKGGISDAFKRAAVKWGIGRYLYDLPAPWVACEYYERGGKKHWKRWAADPWASVKNASDFAPAAPSRTPNPANMNPAKDEPGGEDDLAAQRGVWVSKEIDRLRSFEKASDENGLRAWKAKNDGALARLMAADVALYEKLVNVFDDVAAALRPNYITAG
jgi:hypothetical protein